MGMIVAIVVVHHVVQGATVPFAKAFAEFAAHAFLDRRVPVHFMVICIGMAMLVEVVTGCFDALVKSPALCIAVFRWRLVPTILMDARAGDGLSFMRVGFRRAHRSETENKQGRCEPFYFLHKPKNLLVQAIKMKIGLRALPHPGWLTPVC